MDITHQIIIEECCNAFGVSVKETLSESRKNFCVLARQLACKIMKDELDYSYVEIGKILGSAKKARHHSTAMYSKSTIENYLDVGDPIVVNAYKKVINKIYKKHEGYQKITVYYKPGIEGDTFLNSITKDYPNIMIIKE